MKIARLISSIFFMGLLMVIPFSCCDILDDVIDPIVNEEIGDTLWVHDISGDEYISYGPSLGYDDRIEAVYYAKSGGQINWTPTSIVAVDAKNGQEKWVSPALDHIGAGKLVIGDDGTIYVVGYYTLYAINPANGQFKWSWEIPKELAHSNGNPAFTYGQIGGLSLLSSGNLILASGGSGAFSRGVFNISPSGIMNWYNLDINGWGVASNFVIDANDNAYYYSKQNDQTHTLYSIVGSTGIVRWTKEIYSYGGADNNLMLTTNGSLICSFVLNAGEPFHMYKINSANGTTEWKSTDETNFSVKLIGTDGKIYQQNWGGVFTFSANDGQRSIFGSLNSNIGGAVINSDNQLAVVHESQWVSNVHMYNPDGTIDWQIVYAGMSPNQMVITNNNKIIVFKTRGVVAFQGKASEASSGWPTRYHDYRNTNNVLK